MHAHDHDHAAHAAVEEDREPTYYEKRAYAIEALLIEKGVVTADEIRRGVEVLDSRTAAMAQGFVVLQAARAAEQMDLPEVVAAAQRAMPRVTLVCLLGRPGRCWSRRTKSTCARPATPRWRVCHRT